MGRKKRPAITLQERENELIMLAYDVAEQSRLLDAAKIDGMESQARIEALFEEVKQALTSYRGGRVPDE